MNYSRIFSKSPPSKRLRSPSSKRSRSPSSKRSKSPSRRSPSFRRSSPSQRYSRRSPSRRSAFLNPKTIRIPEDTLIYIMDNFVTEKYEYCGVFDDDLQIIENALTIGSSNVGSANESKGNSLNCTHSYYSDYVWHTHSYISKYYPSVQDILKILKREKIKISFIITIYGYWKLFRYPDELQSGINEKLLAPKITKYLDMFYFKTEKGKKFNTSAVKLLKENLEDLLSDYNFGIEFVKIDYYPLLPYIEENLKLNY
jgi:hypothetical protein